MPLTESQIKKLTSLVEISKSDISKEELDLFLKNITNLVLKMKAKYDKEIINILKKEVPDTTLPKGKGEIPKH